MQSSKLLKSKKHLSNMRKNSQMILFYHIKPTAGNKYKFRIFIVIYYIFTCIREVMKCHKLEILNY